MRLLQMRRLHSCITKRALQARAFSCALIALSLQTTCLCRSISESVLHANAIHCTLIASLLQTRRLYHSVMKCFSHACAFVARSTEAGTKLLGRARVLLSGSGSLGVRGGDALARSSAIFDLPPLHSIQRTRKRPRVKLRTRKCS